MIGISVYEINAIRLNGNSLPMPLGFGMTVVLSGSMEPELSVGDLLIVVKTDEVAIDDVIVFQTGRTPIVHRVVAIGEETVTTRGDANNTEDTPIPYSCIKGRVIGAIPFIGYLVNLIKTPIGTILLLGAAIWLLEGSFKKDKKKDQDELAAIKAEIERLKNEQN